VIEKPSNPAVLTSKSSLDVIGIDCAAPDDVLVGRLCSSIEEDCVCVSEVFASDVLVSNSLISGMLVSNVLVSRSSMDVVRVDCVEPDEVN